MQIILIDDGSADSTGEICEEYGKRFPNNISVIHQPNSGVSAARNRGVMLVEGTLVSFMDSDDKISAETLNSVWNFYLHHKDEVDLITVPVHLIDGARGAHFLDGKNSIKGRESLIYLKRMEWCKIM